MIQQQQEQIVPSSWRRGRALTLFKSAQPVKPKIAVMGYQNGIYIVDSTKPQQKCAGTGENCNIVIVAIF